MTLVVLICPVLVRLSLADHVLGIGELLEITGDMKSAADAKDIQAFFTHDFRFHERLWKASGNTFLPRLLSQLMLGMQPQATNAGVELTLALRDRRPIWVMASEDKLKQAFCNLIDNALKFTSHGGNIVVETDAQGGDAIVRVRDTGAGIPYKDLPHVFERFYVADRSRARGLSGAGLGLSIARQIAEAHRGAIEVQSMLGVGTVFTVRVPILQLSQEA